MSLTVGAAAEPIRQVKQPQFIEVRQRRIRGHRALAVIEAWRFRGRDQVGPDLQRFAVDGDAARCVEELHEGEVRIARAVVPLQRTAWCQEDNTSNAAKFKAHST